MQDIYRKSIFKNNEYKEANITITFSIGIISNAKGIIEIIFKLINNKYFYKRNDIKIDFVYTCDEIKEPIIIVKLKNEEKIYNNVTIDTIDEVVATYLKL